MKTVVNKKRFFIFGISAMVLGILYYVFIYDKYYTVVEGKIYRSAQLSDRRLEEVIHEDKIRTIINLRGEFENTKWYKNENKVAAKNKVTLYSLRFHAHELPGYRNLNALIDALQIEQRPILIHCWQGSDRAGMASALALAIEKDPPLPDLKKQFSWKFGLIPLRETIGAMLFKQYEKWLAANATDHSRETLLNWIINQYRDAAGNIEYYIDLVNTAKFGPEHEVTINKDSNKITIIGWAFDARKISPVQNLYVHIGDKLSARVKYQFKRPDVVTFFNLEQRFDDNFKVGWIAEFETKILPAGCHKIFLRRIENGSDIMRVPTKFKLCLNE